MTAAAALYCAALTFLVELSHLDPAVSVAKIIEKGEQKDTVCEHRVLPKLRWLSSGMQWDRIRSSPPRMHREKKRNRKKICLNQINSLGGIIIL